MSDPTDGISPKLNGLGMRFEKIEPMSQFHAVQLPLVLAVFILVVALGALAMILVEVVQVAVYTVKLVQAVIDTAVVEGKLYNTVLSRLNAVT